MADDTPQSQRKAQLDAMLLTLPGVSARTINGLDAYFVSDKMFACISGKGVGLRPPRRHHDGAPVLDGQRRSLCPGGMASTREWIQIDRANPADYQKDLPLFEAALEFVRTGRTR